MNEPRKTVLTLLVLLAVGLIMLCLEWLWETASRRWLALVGVGLAVLVILLGIHFAHARDLGQWEATEPALRDWYQALMQPDIPTASCCGEADAYWCDDYYARGDKAFCRITDDRPDAPRGRPHVDIGTEVEVPPHKLKWDKSNPTGHGVVFMARSGFVYCYVQPGGV